jgi:glycine/serine hydroxymethyltransferase
VTNAAALADALKDNGLDLVSGGTDNHLMLVNLSRSRLDVTGRDAEEAPWDAPASPSTKMRSLLKPAALM